MFLMDFETKGKKIGSIPVEMTYRIIELFSAGLYSSPNKAFEELVCNSYDAGAKKVSVFVSPDKSSYATPLPGATFHYHTNGINAFVLFL